MCGIVGYIGDEGRYAAPDRGAQAPRVPRLRLGRRRRHERQRRRDAEGGGQDLAARGRCRAPARCTATSASRTRAGRRTARRTSATRTRTSTATGTIAVVHNGIIENYDRCCADARGARLHVRLGHRHRSARAPDRGSVRRQSLEEAVIDALAQVEGTYGIAVVSSRRSRTRSSRRGKGSPLLIGLGDGEYYVASDVAAILAHTRQVVYLDDGEMAVLDADGYRVHRPERDRDASRTREQDRLGPRPDRARRLRRTSC